VGVCESGGWLVFYQRAERRVVVFGGGGEGLGGKGLGAGGNGGRGSGEDL
jgi:hypothetical protein